MMRDDEIFLSELELYPLVKIQRAALGLTALAVTPSPVRLTDAKRSAMPPSTATANRLNVASPVAQDYARKQAQTAPDTTNTGTSTFKKAVLIPDVVLDADRAPKIATLDWLALQNQVSACADCGLCNQRKQAVFGLGAVSLANNMPAPATWMFVGDAPGVDDDSQGEPFLGEAGKLVDAMLRAANLKRGEDVFMTNVIKCRPPGNRTPTASEIATCTPYLLRQIALVQPKIIVAFGKIAMQALTGSELSITQLRGSVHYVAGIPLVATFNPAFLLRNMPEKAKVWDDLLLAKSTLASRAP
jgi:uracil-DNA glycosylase